MTIQVSCSTGKPIYICPDCGHVRSLHERGGCVMPGQYKAHGQGCILGVPGTECNCQSRRRKVWDILEVTP